MSTKRLIGALIISAIALVSCGSETKPAAKAAEKPLDYAVATKATITAGQPVPAPVGPVVLTLSGAIGTTNVGDTLQFDLETIERLGLVKYTVDDKIAEGRVASFSGVLMERLLAVAGVESSAKSLATKAVNDYEVTIPMSDITAYPVLVATSVDGERMPVDKYGPLRVIYPYGAYGLKPPVADEKLIWQLVAIDVK